MGTWGAVFVKGMDVNIVLEVVNLLCKHRLFSFNCQLIVKQQKTFSNDCNRNHTLNLVAIDTVNLKLSRSKFH